MIVMVMNVLFPSSSSNYVKEKVIPAAAHD